MDWGHAGGGEERGDDSAVEIVGAVQSYNENVGNWEISE